MLIGFLKGQRKKFLYYDAITGMSNILRRYFVMNSFDGALTTFGYLLGSFLLEASDPFLVVKIGIATAIAIAFSGLTGALLTESAERTREIKSMEKALHRKLDGTEYKKAHDSASILTAIVNGVSPLLASLVLLLPFFLLEVPLAYYVSFGLAFVLFFVLGLFLGKISKESMIRIGLKLVLAGILCMIVILIVDGKHEMVIEFLSSDV